MTQKKPMYNIESSNSISIKESSSKVVHDNTTIMRESSSKVHDNTTIMRLVTDTTQSKIEYDTSIRKSLKYK